MPNAFFVFFKVLKGTTGNKSRPFSFLRLITVRSHFFSSCSGRACINRRKVLWLIISIGGHFLLHGNHKGAVRLLL